MMSDHGVKIRRKVTGCVDARAAFFFEDPYGLPPGPLSAKKAFRMPRQITEK